MSRTPEHVLAAATNMVGACLTVVGLIKVLEQHGTNSRIDQLLALNAIGFVLSVGASYLSLRHAKRPRLSAYYERLAETVFMTSIIVMLGSLFLFSFDYL